MGSLWNEVPTPVFTITGALARGAAAYFYTGSSTTPLVVYRDAALTQPHPWPVIADVNGVFPAIFVPYVTYRRRIVTSTGVLISDVGDIPNPAPPSGGGGVVVTADQIFQTGDPIWRMRSGAMLGWVRMNGLTLGSATSGATEYAAADAQPLFVFLWNGLPNGIAPVSGGRGASGAADFAANKTIVIPTMQGYLGAGVDDLGNAAAGRIQVLTTCTATNASPTITVASAAGVGKGMFVIIDGAAAGQVTAVSGVSVTLDTPYAGASGPGKAARFSWFADAQQVGQAGGAQSYVMTTAELAAHTHVVTDPGHTHLYTTPNPNAAGAGANGMASVGGSVPTSSSTTGVTNQSTGQGLPASIVQPTRLGTFYMKL